MSTLKHLRSSVSNKRPTASGLADGQLGINTASGTPGLYFKSTASGIVKVGPAHVGTTAPNNSPAGSAGNSTGEFWVDNSLTTHGLKYYTGSTFYNLTPSGTTSNSGLVELATNAETQTGSDTQRAVTPASLQSKVSDSTSTTSSTIIASSTAVKSAYDLANAALPKAGGTVTGELLLAASGSLVFEGSVDDGFETTLAVTNPTADRTITLPDVTGTVVTTGDTGSVTSTMIANDTIVNADINSAANIAFSKLATGALPSGITVNSSNIVDGSIVNADINATAAIAGTKISPNFGSQTIATTGRIGVGTTSPTTNVQLTSSAPTATIGNIYIAPTTAGQARYQLYNNGAVAEWILGQKTSTNHDFVLSKSVAGSESDYLIIDTSGNVNFQGTGTRIRNGRIIDCSGSTDSLTLYGGNNDGANIELYGGSHATNADLVVFDAGEHRFRSADALTERARIDSSGRLLIGTSTALGVGSAVSASLLIETTTSTLPAAFTRNDASATGPILSFGKSRGTTAGSLTAVVNGDTLGEMRFAGADGTTRNSLGAQIQVRVDGTPATGDMPGRLVFGTTPSGSAAPVERMRIASNGNVSVGTTTSTGTKFLVSANGDGSTSYHGIRVVPVFDSTASTYAASFVSVVDVEDTTWTLPNLDHFVANQSAFGAATVTSQFGFKVNSSLTGATNNYGFFSNIASGTGRWNFYANGTADSYFASNNFIFANGGTERARFDSSGRLLVGTSASVLATIGTETALTQIVGATPQLMILTRSADAVPAHYIIGKARGTSNEIVLNNDNLGLISFQGADGTNLVRAAEIRVQVDGTPGINDMPGRLMFSTTADGASSPTERMRIRSDGGIGFGGTGFASVGFYNQRNITGGTTAYANYVNADALSDVTSTAFAHATSLGTIAASFTLGNLVHYSASQAPIGAGSTVTNQYGFNASSTISGATNNYGFYSNLTSGTGRWNFYANGTADSYFASNNFIFAPAGTEKARFDSSGRLLVGTSSAQTIGTSSSWSLQVATAGIAAIRPSNDTSPCTLTIAKTRSTSVGTYAIVQNNDYIGVIDFVADDGTDYVTPAARISAEVDGTPGINDMPGRLVFSTTADGASSPTERMRIRSDGGIGFGGIGAASVGFYNTRNITGGTTAYANYVNADALSDVTSTAYAHATSLGTTAASFTLNNLVHYNASQASIGAGSTVTNQYGFNAASTISGATNNYGFYSNLTSGTGRWNFYANGTADSYFASNNFIFAPAGTEKARFDPSGRLLLGSSTSIPVISSNASIQLNSTSTNNGAFISLARFNNDAGTPLISFAKSRNSTITPGTIVQNGDILGDIVFCGDDGNTLNAGAARIRGIVDGAPASGSIPGSLSFLTTPAGSASPVERLRITSSGLVAYDQPTPLARNTSTTLTVADLKTKIIVSAPASGITLTLPSGGLLEADFPSIYTGVTFDWSIINTSATNAITLASGVGHTIVGSGGVAPNVSARFTTRRTATSNTFISYRLC